MCRVLNPRIGTDTGIRIGASLMLCHVCVELDLKTFLLLARRCRDLWPLWEGSHRCHRSPGPPAERTYHSKCTSELDYTLRSRVHWKMANLTGCCALKHALRLSAFGQLHKVLGMDPLPSKMPKKPRSETPIDYTGASGQLGCNIQAIHNNHGKKKFTFILHFTYKHFCSANPTKHGIRSTYEKAHWGRRRNGWQKPQQEKEKAAKEM